MIQVKKTLMSVAIGIVMAGCGGGGGFPVSPPVVLPGTVTIIGKVVDGYVSGATVVCDNNPTNGVQDAGEISVISSSNGTFDFSTLGANISCNGPLLASGGTDIDTGFAFKGVFKAPSGSAFITVLSSVMVSGGMTAAQVAAALGLPVGTDVTKIDPMTDLAIHKKVMAVLQIIQQITDTLSDLAMDASPVTQKAIYSAVTQAVAETLKANAATPLVSSNGDVSSLLVSSIIVKSLTTIKNSNNSELLVAKIGLNQYSGTSIAKLTAGSITAQAQKLAKAGDAAALLTSAKSLQANPTISNAVRSLSTLLTTDKESIVNLDTIGNELALLFDDSADNDSAAKTDLSASVTLEASKAGVPPIVLAVLDINEWSQPSNVLALRDDSIELNGKVYTLAQFAAGVTLDKKTSPLDMVSFTYDVRGTPVPADANGVMKSSVSLGIELSDTGTKGQVLQFILDRADVTVSADGQIGVSVPTGALLYAYGKTSGGTAATAANVTLANDAADSFIVVANNQLSFNAGKVLNKIAQDGTVFAGLKNITGEFNLKVVVSNLSIASQTQTSIKGLSVSVTNTTQKMSGLGVQGIFTVE
jgi:hypothetical protein